MPYLRGRPPAFTFLVHPRDVVDLYNVPGSSVVAAHSATEDEFRDKILTLPPTITGEATFGLGAIRGDMLAVLCMPERIMFPEGRRQIADAVAVAASRGVSVIGLGALTAPATRGGLTLVPDLPRGITLTTGNAYTAAVARTNVVQAAEAAGLDDGAVVAVVGCTGSVGSAATRLIDLAGFRLILIGRSQLRVHKELADIETRAVVSGSIADVGAADIVLLLTGDPSARLTPELLKPGSIVLDLAHPLNIQKADYPQFAARDVRVFQGGLVAIPGYRNTLDMRLTDRHSSLACLAETYLFAKEGITEHSVGQTSVGFALDIEEVAARHGVRARPLDLQTLAAAIG